MVKGFVYDSRVAAKRTLFGGNREVFTWTRRWLKLCGGGGGDGDGGADIIVPSVMQPILSVMQLMHRQDLICCGDAMFSYFSRTAAAPLIVNE